MTVLCNDIFVLNYLEYGWLVHVKPILTLILSGLFGCLSLIIIYAEIAMTFDFKHNLIYDIVTAPDID